MSRVGRMPIDIPAGVNVNLDGHVITVKGPERRTHSYASPGYENYSR